jgi:hypothetical protein
MPQPEGTPSGGRRRWTFLIALAGLAMTAAVIMLIIGGGPERRPATTSPLPSRRPPPGQTRSTSTTTAPSTPPPARPAPSGEQLGANVNWLFNARDYPQRLIDAQLAALSGSGATIARSDAIWGYAEPRPPVAGMHTYDWSFDDLIAGSLAAHGLTWLPVIDYSAPWSQAVPGNLHSPPSDPAAYAAYAAALAVRYGAGGSFWAAHPELPSPSRRSRSGTSRTVLSSGPPLQMHAATRRCTSRRETRSRQRVRRCA